MTTISTVDDLNTVPIGQRVRIERSTYNAEQEWLRVESGFEKDGTILGAQYFSGALAAGLVRSGPVFVAGEQWRHRSSVKLVIIEVTPEGHARTIRFSGSDYYDMYVMTTPGTMVREEPDDNTRALFTLGRQLYREVDRQGAAVIPPPPPLNGGGLQEFRANIEVALGDLVTMMDDDDDAVRLRNVMTAHDLTPPRFNERSEIRVTGLSRVTPNVPATDLTSDSEMQVCSVAGEVRVEWSIYINEPISSTTTVDVCEDREVINDEWVEEQLAQRGIVWDSYEMGARACSNCQ